MQSGWHRLQRQDRTSCATRTQQAVRTNQKKKAKLKSVSLDVVVMVMTVLGRVLEVRPSEEDMTGRSK
jgi:hypothetical protein